MDFFDKIALPENDQPLNRVLASIIDKIQHDIPDGIMWRANILPKFYDGRSLALIDEQDDPVHGTTYCLTLDCMYANWLFYIIDKYYDELALIGGTQWQILNFGRMFCYNLEISRIRHQIVSICATSKRYARMAARVISFFYYNCDYGYSFGLNFVPIKFEKLLQSSATYRMGSLTVNEQKQMLPFLEALKAEFIQMGHSELVNENIVIGDDDGFKMMSLEMFLAYIRTL